uniref:CSON005629 protein n=1 Tax=Culicoides sonorensis TaxID=179676 RepID=A0A336LMC6_CULSO
MESYDIFELAQLLRQNQLFLNSERKNYGLSKQLLLENSANVYKLAWIQSQERQNLTDLILARPLHPPDSCSFRASQLQASKFFDVFKLSSIKYQHVCELMKLLVFLQKSPYLLAQCMSIADKINQVIPSQNDKIVHIICDSFYGCLLNTKDIEMILSILQQLIQLQIVNHETPRRMLRPSSSSFARLYQRLHSSLSSAKLFLLASLHQPVISVLIEDQKMDVNTSNIDENNAQMNDFVSKKDLSLKLFELTNRFVKSLTENWLLFPSPLSWLIQKLCFSLKQANFKEEETYMILTDMIFTNFIIPAVVSPDLYGIIDTQIDLVAQFNLIQIGQILQMLALHKYQPIETKMKQFYDKFDQNAIPNLVHQLMPQDYGIFHQNLCASLFSAGQTNIHRDKLLISRTELNLLLDFLRTVIENDGTSINSKSKKELVSILEKLPNKIEEISDLKHESKLETVHRSKQGLIVQLAKASKQKSNKSSNDDFEENYSNEENSACSFINGKVARSDTLDEVLVFPVSLETDESFFNLLPEAEVLGMNTTAENDSNVEQKLTEKNIELSRCNVTDPIISNEVDDIISSNREKHTSEAPSNHSVTSSLDLEENDQNDNLSDMVSANVSGRGTPNISGRDTPSSQVTESGNNQIPQQMVKIINKNRSDIEDKFCKFEIKKLLEGDETVSIISDTWSTDAVLASDSETIDANDRNFATPLIPNNIIMPGDYILNNNLVSHFRVANFEETQSESNWSTDVLGSDSEKPNEIDVEDGANKPSDLPSPDSLYNENQQSIKEQEAPISYLENSTVKSDNSSEHKNGDIQGNQHCDVGARIKKKEKNGNKDLICLDECELNNIGKSFAIIKSDSNITNPFFNEEIDTTNEFSVQHRRSATVQRNSYYDSRRNGINSKIVTNSELNSQSGNELYDLFNISKPDTINTNTKVSRNARGAIPKSISFDSTADKNEQYSPNKRSGLLNKIKGLASMKVRKNRLYTDQQSGNDKDMVKNVENMVSYFSETTDEILGKYRRKVSTSSEPTSSDSAGSNSSSSIKSKSSKSDLKASSQSEIEPDLENIKRKIKMVLCRSSVPSTDFKSNCRISESPIHTYLKIQMAEATDISNLQDITYTFEALRLLNTTNLLTQHKLYQHLQSELITGQRYIQYLTKCRQNLLLSMEMVEKLQAKISNERDLCMKNLILCCVRMFLEKHEQLFQNFYESITKLLVADEKIEIMKEFIQTVLLEIQKDGILRGVLITEELEVKECVEKLIMQKVYKQLMFPNDDVDKSRDLSCHCIMSMLAMSNNVPSADDLTPVLIFVIIKSNPPHLLSTIQYVNCYIDDKLEGEENYWWTQFVTAVEFIKSMDY